MLDPSILTTGVPLGAVVTVLAMSPLVSGVGSLQAQDADTPVALVTGSTSGLGREVALELADLGYHVVVHGRNEERGRAVVAEIERGGRGSSSLLLADLGSFAEVRALASDVADQFDRLDLLVNNAGIWLQGPRRLSEDGHELHFQVNYLSGFLLTRLLLPLVTASDGRIVNVSSLAQQPLDFDNLMLAEGYSDGRAYSQSKLAQIMFTLDLAAELEGTGVEVVALHPATMMDTNMVLSRGAATRSSVDEGTEAVMNLVTGDVESGGYYNGLQAARANGQAYDDAVRDRLRRLSEELTGITSRF